MVIDGARPPARQACDACRLRKIKCEPLDQEDQESTASTATITPTTTHLSCRPCSRGKLDCTYLMPVKRRGPPPKRRRIPVDSDDGNNNNNNNNKDENNNNDHPSADSSKSICTTHASHDTLRRRQSLLISSPGLDSPALQRICSPAVFDIIIKDYLDIVYPLVPVVHLPTFQADLKNERHMHDLVFQSFCLAMCALVLGILPRKFDEYRNIDGSLAFLNRREAVSFIHNWILKNRPMDYFDELSHEKWAIAYMISTTSAHLGNVVRAKIQHGETTCLCEEMGLHRISSYAGLDNVEAQLRKKAFWLNFTTYSHMQSHEIKWDSLPDRFIFDVADAELLMPLEIDDEYITPTKIFDQPQGKTSVVAGFNALTLINNCLVSIIRDQSLPLLSCNEPMADNRVTLQTCPCGRHVQKASITALVEARLHKTKYVLNDLPAELRPWPSPSNQMPISSTADALLFSQYESMKANIHVTHLWVQSLLLERFVASQQVPRNSHKLEDPQKKHQIWEMREDICQQLLHLLNNISQANLEPNGYFLLVKTREVAASLLDCQSGEEDHISQRAMAYIQSFADILGRLDNAYQNDFQSSNWEELDEQTREPVSKFWHQSASGNIPVHRNT